MASVCTCFPISFPSGLVMLQTTNSIINRTLYDKATPKALLAWHRVRLANWLAEGGKEWADIVSQYNSGKSRTLLRGEMIYEARIFSGSADAGNLRQCLAVASCSPLTLLFPSLPPSPPPSPPLPFPSCRDLQQPVHGSGFEEGGIKEGDTR